MRRMVRFGGAGPKAGFRLSVSPGGCSGLASQFSVEATPLAGDSVIEWNGLKVFLPEESRGLLDGVIIDFADTPMSSGLIFHDPKAANCGSCSTATPGVSTVSLSSLRRPGSG
jgi:iron-sulfur cluster assembly accessory protein